MPDETSPPVVVILAAGMGRRFLAAGGQGDKLQADLLGRPVLEWTLAAVRASNLPWTLVERPDESAQALGMGDSIARGIGNRPEAPGWLILPGDMPLIRPDSILHVARTLRASAAIQPNVVVRPEVVVNGEARPGHPVGFGPGWKDALLALRGDAGAIKLVQAASRQELLQRLTWRDIGCIHDVDQPADLHAASHLNSRINY